MLTVRNLHKTIDGEHILQEISFEIQPGTIVGLAGRNGVGKTTLLKTIVGILDPEQGEVLWEGDNLLANPEAKASLYYVPDSISMFHGYTINEMIRLHKAIYPAFNESKLKAYIERFKLPYNRNIKSFSRGMKALLFILFSISTNARLIVLDEPTNGLDVIMKKQILQILLDEVAEYGVSLLISTHHLAELEKLADTVLFMKHGKIELTVRLEETNRLFKKVQVAFHEDRTAEFRAFDNVEIIQQIGRVSTLLIKGNSANVWTKLLEAKPLLLEELPMTMEDIFVTILGGDQHVS